MSEEIRLLERRQRIISCTENGCGVYHYNGHVLTEERIVTPWIGVEIGPVRFQSIELDDAG